MFFKPNVAIITDAYSTGRFLAPCFIAYGFDCIHIRTSKEVPYLYGNTYRPADFIAELLFDEVMKAPGLIRDRYNPVVVISGSESGVEIAEEIAHLLKLESRNVKGTARRCRDKYLMQQALEDCGIKGVKQILTDDLQAMLSWTNTNGSYPVVIKPVNSSSSDNVHVCHSAGEVENAFHSVITSENTLKQKNSSVLAQEYLRGTPFPDGHEQDQSVNYNVNTVSLDGDHYVSEVLEVRKNASKGTLIHDYMQLMCPVAHEELYGKLGEYVSRVLTSLGILSGVSHSEVMFVRGQPMLIETAARGPGGSDPSFYTRCTGHNQLLLYATAVVNPDAYRSIVRGPRQALRRQGCNVFLWSETHLKVTADKRPDFWIERLPSLHSLMIKDRDEFQQTISLKDSPGNIYLISEDRKQLDNDRALIRAYQAEFLNSMKLPPG